MAWEFFIFYFSGKQIDVVISNGIEQDLLEFVASDSL